jgi:hypothetical protein
MKSFKSFKKKYDFNGNQYILYSLDCPSIKKLIIFIVFKILKDILTYILV